MRVLYLQPGAGIGGSKISLLSMLRHVARGQTSQVALARPRNSEYESELTGLAEKIHYLDLPTWNSYHRSSLLEKVRAPFSNARRLAALIPAAWRLAAIIHRERIGLVHTNNAICPAGAIAAGITRIPHVWHIREPVGSRGQYPLILGDWLAAYLFSALSRRIICNSNYTAEFFRSRHIEVDVVPNTLEYAAFRGAAAQRRGRGLRSRLTGGGDGTAVGMVGNLASSWKSHGTFLEVAALVRASSPGCRFVIFGGATEANVGPQTRRIRALADKLCLGSAVVFASFIPDIPAMMHSLDILVHPAITEGSGRVIMEAMAAGKPVVAFNAGGVRELVRDGVTGFLVAAGDVGGMAARVSELLADRTLRISMGRKAAALARGFDAAGTASGLRDIYTRALDRRQ